MFTLELLLEAEIEIKEACKWYDSKQVGLASKLLNEIEHYFNLISQNPLQFPVKFSEAYRFAVLRILPILCCFQVR